MSLRHPVTRASVVHAGTDSQKSALESFTVILCHCVYHVKHMILFVVLCDFLMSFIVNYSDLESLYVIIACTMFCT